jgi:hypothetical protein
VGGAAGGRGDGSAAGDGEGWRIAGAAGSGGNGVAQPAANATASAAPSIPRARPLLQSSLAFRSLAMWLILLEAALALGLLVLIVWWTMFHRPRRKPPEDR